MERLHAYWRYEYIEAPKENGKSSETLFEDLPKRGDDEANYILYRTKFCYLVLNTFPYNAGHLLAIPYRAVQKLSDLTAEERLDLMNLLAFAEDLLRKALKPEGINLGINLGKAAGAGIPQHLHVHIVPRWNGDTNFMPVIGETRVLPLALKDMWKRLKSFIEL